MADWRKALGLSQSSLTLVWRMIFAVCIKSYHARTSCSFRKFCSASVAPSMCLCLSHGRALQHPRLKFAGRWDHFQRQWVSLSIPGHSGLCSGPRARPTSGWAVTYRTSKYTAVSFSLLWRSSHTSSPPMHAGRNLFRCRTSTPQMIRAKRLVSTPRHLSVPWSSTQSPRLKALLVFGVNPPPQKCFTTPWESLDETCHPNLYEHCKSLDRLCACVGSCICSATSDTSSLSDTGTPSHRILSHVSRCMLAARLCIPRRPFSNRWNETSRESIGQVNLTGGYRDVTVRRCTYVRCSSESSVSAVKYMLWTIYHMN